jgi:hypothetical protein
MLDLHARHLEHSISALTRCWTSLLDPFGGLMDFFLYVFYQESSSKPSWVTFNSFLVLILHFHDLSSMSMKWIVTARV